MNAFQYDNVSIRIGGEFRPPNKRERDNAINALGLKKRRFPYADAAAAKRRGMRMTEEAQATRRHQAHDAAMLRAFQR